MIVPDASAVIEVVLGTKTGERVTEQILGAPALLHAPHLLDVEVGQGLRKLLLLRSIDEPRATRGLRLFRDLRIRRHTHCGLLPRCWQLRNSMTIYDAMYVALAEVLGAELITCDVKLAKASGHDATIRLL